MEEKEEEEDVTTREMEGWKHRERTWTEEME